MKPRSKLAIAASAALILAFLLPWVQIFGFGASGYNLSQIGSYGNWAWLVPVIAVLVALIHASPRALQRAKNAASILGALLVASGMAYALLQVSEKTGPRLGQALGIGVYLLFAACVLLFISGCQPPSGADAVPDGGPAPEPRSFEEFLTQKIAEDSAYKSFRRQDLMGEYSTWLKQFTPPPAGAPSFSSVAAIDELSRLREAGLITEEEFSAKRSEILSRL